jgi:hypothetical protein
MSQLTLTAVDSVMAFHDPSVPQNIVDAWSYTATFAQAHTRTVTSDTSSHKYFTTMTKEFQDLAWNVTNAGKVSYQQASNKISPAGIVSSILNPYLSNDQQQQLAGLLNAIQQPDTSVSNFIDFFWKKASVTDLKTNMAVGPLTVVNNSANITLIYFGFDYSETDWRSLFVEVDSAALGVTAYNLEMNLNLALYNSVKDSLISKLGGKEAQHIQNTSLDL